MVPLISRVPRRRFGRCHRRRLRDAAAAAACRPRTAPMPAPTPPMMPPTVPLSLRLGSVSFAELQGWADNDPQGGARGVPPILRRDLDAARRRRDGRRQLCRHGRRLAPALPAGVGDCRRRRADRARIFRGRVRSLSPHPILGRRSLHRLLRAAIEGQPDQARPLSDAALWNPGGPHECRSRARSATRSRVSGSSGRSTNGRLVPYPARADIEGRGLHAGQAAALCRRRRSTPSSFRSRARAASCSTTAASCARPTAAQNGRAYTAIGAVLIQRGELKREEVSMQSIRAWLMAHPEEAPQIMNANASYVFFTEQALGDPCSGRRRRPGRAADARKQASRSISRCMRSACRSGWKSTSPNPDPAMPEQTLRAAYGHAGHRRRHPRPRPGRRLLGLQRGRRLHRRPDAQRGPR